MQQYLGLHPTMQIVRENLFFCTMVDYVCTERVERVEKKY